MALTYQRLAPEQATERHRAFEARWRALWAIFTAAIDPSEQRSEPVLRALAARADYVFLTQHEGGRLLGLAVIYAPADQDFWMLEYLAVDGRQRGRGLGAALFGRCVAMFSDRRFGLLEVEAHAPARPGAELRARRLGFYRSLGCREVAGIAYQLPLSTRGRKPPPMVLLAHADTRIEAVPRTDLRRWLRAIYVGAYAQAPTDRRIAAMVAPLGRNATLAPIAATRASKRPTA